MSIPELKVLNHNNENNRTLQNIAPNNIKEDILYFKDDILKDLKKIEYKLNSKVYEQSSIWKDKLENFNLKLEAMTEKISSLGCKISTNISLKEKVDELNHFKNKFQENLITQDIRIDSIINDLKNAINKYDSILLDSVIYSGIIGVNAKFKTFHEFIDFVLLNISQLNIFKEKNNLDLKSYRKKIESLTQNLKIQIESINKNNMEFNNNQIKEAEKRTQIFFDEYNSKLMQIRMENNQYGQTLEEKANLLIDNYKKMEKLKIDIEDRIKYEVNKIGDISESLSVKFDNYQNEFNSIKKRFIVLSEFIKNNKFQNNEIKNITNKLKFNKKANNLIEKENQEIFKQKIEEDINESNNNIKLCKSIQINSPDVSISKHNLSGDVILNEICEDKNKLTEKQNISYINNLSIVKEIQLIITSEINNIILVLI